MIKIGITGGIGAGKSYVAERFVACGIPVYSCDDEAKRLMVSDAALVSSLKSAVASDVYNPDGSLNKAVLAEFIFSDACNREKINSLVHPVVFDDFLRWADGQNAPMVAVESAILFESGLSLLVDKTVCVTAPVELRIERVVARDAASRESVEARIKSQMDDGQRVSKADFVIYNDGVRAVDNQIRNVINAL